MVYGALGGGALSIFSALFGSLRTKIWKTKKQKDEYTQKGKNE